MKIFSRKEKFSPKAFSGLTEQDKINFLGAMCMCCDPVVVKGGLIEFVRSEYVPQNKDDIELARQLFASSGIDLKVRYVNVSRYAKMPMLRSRLFYTSRNSVLNKTPDELNLEDICMLVRQEFFLEIAVPRAVKILESNHSAGDNYDYSLLVNLSNIESSLSGYKDIISNLVNTLEKDYKKIKFELESDEQDYLSSIEKLKEKIK